jgi:hypothetical protein
MFPSRYTKPQKFFKQFTWERNLNLKEFMNLKVSIRKMRDHRGFLGNPLHRYSEKITLIILFTTSFNVLFITLVKNPPQLVRKLQKQAKALNFFFEVDTL